MIYTQTHMHTYRQNYKQTNTRTDTQTARDTGTRGQERLAFTRISATDQPKRRRKDTQTDEDRHGGSWRQTWRQTWDYLTIVYARQFLVF